MKSVSSEKERITMLGVVVASDSFFTLTGVCSSKDDFEKTVLVVHFFSRLYTNTTVED